MIGNCQSPLLLRFYLLIRGHSDVRDWLYTGLDGLWSHYSSGRRITDGQHPSADSYPPPGCGDAQPGRACLRIFRPYLLKLIRLSQSLEIGLFIEPQILFVRPEEVARRTRR